MNSDEFEQRVGREPLRRAPAEWRQAILASSRRAATRPSTLEARPSSWLSTLNSQLSALLWPHTKAWVGLAAIWMLIAALQFTAREPKPSEVEHRTWPSPQIAEVLKSQRQLMAEFLADRTQLPDADRHSAESNRPRSEASRKEDSV